MDRLEKAKQELLITAGDFIPTLNTQFTLTANEKQLLKEVSLKTGKSIDALIRHLLVPALEDIKERLDLQEKGDSIHGESYPFASIPRRVTRTGGFNRSGKVSRFGCSSEVV